jgi:bile acid:Na+ symporter, BASS family
MMRKLIETHFGVVLLLACGVGLLLPGLPSVPDISASFALALLTFASCFKLRDGGFDSIRWRHVGVFYVLRYGLLPVLLLLAAQAAVPQYAMGIFLLACLPTAVSSPAFAHMFGGRVPPAFAIVILSTCLAPLLIPLHFSWVGGMMVAPSPMPLFTTLVLCVLVPMFFYRLARRHRAVEQWMYDRVKIISIVLVAFVIALVIAKQREVILADVTALWVPFVAIMLCYTVFIVVGWVLAGRVPRDVAISMATCSGFNNVALGVSVALLHFPPDVVLFVAVSEVGWAMLPMLMRVMLRVLPAK